MFSYGFGNAAAYVIARTVADSAFLSQIGPDRLPALYVVAAGVVALSSLLYGFLVRRLSLRHVIQLTLLGLAAASALVPWLMLRFPQSLTVFAGAYLLAQIRGSLGTIQFATLFNEQFPDNPERVVGLVGAGATLAGIVVGSGIGMVSELINLKSLMWLAAGIDLAAMLPVSALRPLPTATPVQTHSAGTALHRTDNPRLADAIRLRYVLGIASVTFLSVAVATLVEYQWKVTAATELLRDEAKLARYFGLFYGGVYLATGLLQCLATGYVLRQRSVLVGLLVFPLALLSATATALLFSAGRLLLWPMTLSKACDTLRRSMHDPSIQVLYGPLESLLRRQSIAFVAGIVKPFAEAAAAVTLLLMTTWWSLRAISWLVVILIAVWLMFDVAVFRRFSRMRR